MTSDAAARAVALDEVLDLYRTYGTHRYDEAVTQLEHARQTAAHARGGRAPDPLVAAALLHDVGHLLALRDGVAGDHDLEHERRGARWLAGLFPPDVTGPIALHVAAKRYRCAVDPAYASRLSPGSVASLARQGGPMDAAEASRFGAHPGARAAVALRGWDDAGKDTSLPSGTDIDDERPLLERVATR